MHTGRSGCEQRRPNSLSDMVQQEGSWPKDVAVSPEHAIVFPQNRLDRLRPGSYDLDDGLQENLDLRALDIGVESVVTRVSMSIRPLSSGVLTSQAQRPQSELASPTGASEWRPRQNRQTWSGGGREPADTGAVGLGSWRPGTQTEPVVPPPVPSVQHPPGLPARTAGLGRADVRSSDSSATDGPSMSSGCAVRPSAGPSLAAAVLVRLGHAPLSSKPRRLRWGPMMCW